MPNPHLYGFRFQRSLSGSETPQILTRPIASAYAPNTGVDGAGGTAVNLNIGDPVQLLADGTVRLTPPGQGTVQLLENDSLGVVVGFPRLMIGGAPRPNGFYVSGTTYTGDDQQTLCAFIPVRDNIFEIDTSAAGGASLDTKAEWQSVVGGEAHIIYSVLTSGAGQPKANPLVNPAAFSEAAAVFLQLRIVDLGKRFDTYDPALLNVPLQVMFNQQQLLPATVADLET